MPSTYMRVAVKAAKEAGKIHLKYFNTPIKIRHKSGPNDQVTIADTESEQKIVQTIKKHFPQHNILAEENKYEKTDSEYTWIIDPLDGTNNFSHGMPFFCCSISLAKKGKPILGVIFDPIRKELFTAEKGKGAVLNEKKIHVSNNSDLNDCLLITGFYYNRGIPLLKSLVNIKHFFLKGILGIRRMGSAALDMCNIACGRADGFWELYLSEWDFAAGKIIIEEAGGKLTNKAGEELRIRPGYVVASNGLIHKAMLKIINKDETIF